MEPSEDTLIAKLRRWKCNNPECGHEHSGAPSAKLPYRRCPKCRSVSARTHEVFAVAGTATATESYAVVPKHPSRGKLASMALRYDHAIFAPKQKILGRDFYGKTPGEITSVMTTMSQLYEEAVEQGFYQPAKESEYNQMLDSALESASEDRTAD